MSRNFNSVISMTFNPEKECHLLTWEKDPFLKAKVVKFNNRRQQEAEQYEAEKRNYFIKRVDGYNIFIIHAGYRETPGYIVPDAEIEQIINTMATWYLKNVVPSLSNVMRNKYKTYSLNHSN